MYKNCINIRSSCVESAVQVVAQLALDEADPRVAAVACWGLAAACHAQRHKKSNANSVGGSNAGAQMRALTGLPEDGAMRALAQIVLTGRHSSFPCLSMLFTSCCASSSFCSSSSFLFFFLFHLLLSSMFPYPACSPCSVDLSACLLCSTMHIWNMRLNVCNFPPFPPFFVFFLFPPLLFAFLFCCSTELLQLASMWPMKPPHGQGMNNRMRLYKTDCMKVWRHCTSICTAPSSSSSAAHLPRQVMPVCFSANCCQAGCNQHSHRWLLLWDSWPTAPVIEECSYSKDLSIVSMCKRLLPCLISDSVSTIWLATHQHSAKRWGQAFIPKSSKPSQSALVWGLRKRPHLCLHEVK